MNKIILSNLNKLIEHTKNRILLLEYENNKTEITKNKYRIKVFRYLKKVIENLNYNLQSSNDLKNIPNIGKKSLMRIDEIIKTGKLEELNDFDEINNKIKSIDELKKVIGIGPKIAFDIINKHGIKGINELKKSVGKIKLNGKIILGLKYYGIVMRAIPREETKLIEKRLKQIAKSIGLELVICGSYRRGKSVSNDIDVVIYNRNNFDNTYIIDFVKKLSDSGLLLDHITDKNYKTKYMGFMKYDDYPVRRIDIRLIHFDSLPTTLLANTGPSELNEYMRKIAKSKNMLLNEYGLFMLDSNHNKKPLNIKTEKDIFDKLNIPYLTPEERDTFSTQEKEY